MTPTALFFLKLVILFAGVYILIHLTPHIAAWIDSLKKDAPEAPRPERVDDDLTSENSGDGINAPADDNTNSNNQD